MERRSFAHSGNERGDVALDALWGLLLGSLTLISCAYLTSRVSSTAAVMTREIHGRLAAAKTIAVVTAGLLSVERNRQVFSAQITSGTSLRLPNGLRHPLATISGSSGPRTESDILTVVDLDNRYRGVVTTATISGTSLEATICGLTSRIPSGTFKSYVLLTIEGARQVVGETSTISSSCARLTGSSISGVISAHPSFPSRPLVFVPIDREYSIFVDRAATLRLASHTGTSILENQPISRDVDLMTLQEERQPNGIRLWTLHVRPSSGRAVSHFIIPALTQRHVWNEVLP